MPWISIPHAHEYWRLSTPLAEPPADLDDVEAYILRQEPATPQDAACILDVVCANRGEARADDLDYDALERVRRFLLALA